MSAIAADGSNAAAASLIDKAAVRLGCIIYIIAHIFTEISVRHRYIYDWSLPGHSSR